MSLQRTFQALYEKATSLPYFGTNRYTNDFAAVDAWIDQVSRLHGIDPADVERQLCENFFSDPWIREHGFPVRPLVNEPMRFYRKRKPLSDADKQAKISNLVGKINALASELELARAHRANADHIAQLQRHLDSYRREKRDLETA